MLFMLMSMGSSLFLTASAAPANSGMERFLAPGQTAPTVDMCLALDTDNNLNLTNNEIAKLDIDLDGNGVVNDADRDIISSFCVAAPSTPITFVTICHATGSESKPFEVITINANAVINGHLGVQHQGGEDVIPAFTYNGQMYGPQGDQSLLENGCVPLEPEPDPGTFHVQKYYCDSVEEATVLEGEFDTSGCEAGTATFVILDSNDQEVPFDQDELLNGTLTLPVGDYTLLEYDKNDELVLSVPFTIFADANTIIRIANPLDPGPELGEVIVTKYFCVNDSESPFVADDFDVSECTEGTAIFDIVDGEGVSVLEEGDDVFAGVVLPVGTYWLVEYGENDEVLLEHEFTVLLDEILPIVVVNPVEEEPGLAQVVKFFCADPDITVPVVGQEGDYEGCEPASAEQLDGVNFWVYPFGVVEDAIDIDDSALLGDGVVLPVGTHTLVEEFNGVIHELSDLTIVAGETATIVVFNPVPEEEITINIYKLVCSGFSEAQEDGCVESDELDGTEISFTVTYTIGEDDTSVDTSLVVEEFEGSATLSLPIADSYTVCEDVPDGVEAVTFGVLGVDDAESTADGCITFSGDGLADGDTVEIVFWNDMEDEKPETPETPETPEKPVPPTVTKLPDTGSGAVDHGAATPWMLFASAAVLAGAGALVRRERPAA